MNDLIMSVDSFGISDIGKRRSINQDAFYIDDASGIYIVADGMGGHKGGEIASRLAVETMKVCFEIPLPDKAAKECDPPLESNLSKAATQMVDCIQCANTVIFNKASEEDSLKGMGTTVAAVRLTGETVIAANVGDSPVYLIRDHTIEPLYVPHTLATLQENIQSSFQGAKNILTRSVGVAKTVEVDSCEIQYFKNDAVVLCSDGLCNLVSTDEIMETVENQSPSSACRNLISLANERGGPDNITVIVLKIGAKNRSQEGRGRSFLSGFMGRLGFKKPTS